MTDPAVKRAPEHRTRGRRLRVLVVLSLAACVTLVGVGGSMLAGIVPDWTHIGQPSASAHQPHSQVTSTATPAPQACRCRSVTQNAPQPKTGIPQYSGQVILVSLSQQWLWAYQDGKLVLASPVTTGMPQLPTPQGDYSVQYKETNTTFYSYWGPGSPFYYPPEHINYAMYFRDTGYYIHDAPWRHAFGPGTEYPHTDPDGTHETGSHGCVNMPTPAAATLYAWTGVGARVIITAQG
ncbi:MAG TPA: L,D-transpeptidase [Ktedonobacterales bacterium]